MKKKLFETEEEMIKELGRDNVIPISYLPQNIFYISRYERLQPILVKESDKNEGELVFWYLKALTKKPYQDWQRYKAEQEKALREEEN